MSQLRCELGGLAVTGPRPVRASYCICVGRSGASIAAGGLRHPEGVWCRPSPFTSRRFVGSSPG